MGIIAKKTLNATVYCSKPGRGVLSYYMITARSRSQKTVLQAAFCQDHTAIALQTQLFIRGHKVSHCVFYSWEGILLEVTCSFHIPHRLRYSTVTVIKERDRRAPEIKRHLAPSTGMKKHTKGKDMECRADGLTSLIAHHGPASVAITKYPRLGNSYTE